MHIIVRRNGFYRYSSIVPQIEYSSLVSSSVEGQGGRDVAESLVEQVQEVVRGGAEVDVEKWADGVQIVVLLGDLFLMGCVLDM